MGINLHAERKKLIDDVAQIKGNIEQQQTMLQQSFQALERATGALIFIDKLLAVEDKPQEVKNA